MYAKRRIVYNINGLRAVPLPNGTPVGRMASVAMDKIALVDPSGELEPEDLLGALEQVLEPWLWGPDGPLGVKRKRGPAGARP